MIRARRLHASCAVLALLAPVARAHGTLAPWYLRAEWGEAYNDNIRQSSGPDPDEDFITSLGVGVRWVNPKKHSLLPREGGLRVAGHIYGNYGDFNYVEINPDLTYQLPLRVDLNLEYLFSPRRLLYDDGGTAIPVFYEDNTVSTGLVRRFGAQKQLRAGLGAVVERYTYRDPNQPRDSWTPRMVADLRYRFEVPTRVVDAIVPRCAIEYGTRFADRANFDRNELSVLPGFELQLMYGVSARFRYERLMRNYTVSAPRDADGRRNNNFDREDRSDEYQTWLVVPLAMVPGLSFGARYRFRHGRYDSPNRRVTVSDGTFTVGQIERFDVHEVEIGLVFGF